MNSSSSKISVLSRMYNLSIHSKCILVLACVSNSVTILL